MNAAGGLYPSLGRYFRNMTELANAGCMSRQRARDCLDGKKEFTEAEKKAIAANIAIKLITSPLHRTYGFTQAELSMATAAWAGEFDTVYKVKNERT